MPRFRRDKGTDFFLRDHDGVMANWRDNVVLSSKNRISNPDFKDFGPDDGVEGWKLDAPDRPTGWNVYARQLTRNGANVRDRTQAEKQNGSKLSFHRGKFILDDALADGKPLPDANKRAKIAPPDHIKVKVRNKAGGVGFKAGNYWLSYAYILGPKGPASSERITNTAPAVLLSVSQGQRVEVYLPDAPGEGVIGYVIYMSRAGGSASDLFEQERVDLRYRTPEKITLRGPVHDNPNRKNSATATNKSYIGNLVAPRRWFRVSPWGTDCMIPTSVKLSYRVLTKEGWSQSAPPVTISASQHEGEAISWHPSRFPEGAEAWLPEFMGIDGKWYTLSGRGYGEDGIPLRQEATIPNFNPSHETSWPTTKLEPVETEHADNGSDESGLAGPTTPLDAPVAVGGAAMTPGIYRIYTTFDLGDRESAPSPYRDVTLAESSPGSGVTDKCIYVYRPKVQRITNETWDQRDGDEIVLDWDEPDAHGTTVTFGDGRLAVADNTGRNTDQNIRLADPVDINPANLHTFRARMKCTRYVGGVGKIVLQFLNSGGSVVDSFVAGRVRANGQEDRIRVSFSSDRERAANVRIPGTVTQVRVSIQADGTDSASGNRNLDFYVEHPGLFKGSAARKRVPLNLGLGNDKDEPNKRSPNAENPAVRYPAGAYSRVVESPDDGPRKLDNTLLARENFENGTRNGAFNVNNSVGSQTVERGASIEDEWGLSLTNGGTDGENTISYAPGSNRARMAGSAYFRFHGMSAIEQVIMRGQAGSTGLAWVSIAASDRRISLNVRNGGGTTQIQTSRYARRGVKYRMELDLQGAGTASGRADFNLKVGDNPIEQTSATSLDWTTGQISSIRAGSISGTSYDMDLDDFYITADGIRDTDPLDTNYVEYWAPEGQPYIFRNMMYDMRVPVKPGAQYVVSAYVGSENVQNRATLLTSVWKDEDGHIVGRNDPLCTLKGDNYWERKNKTFTAPDDARYLEFIGGDIADGLIRVGAMQVERGATLTAWDNTNGSSGHFDVYVDTGIAGKPIAEIMDQTFDYIRGKAVANLDESGTDVTIQYRGANTVADLDLATWRTSLNLATATNPRYVEIRTNLTTTDPLHSPEVTGVFLDTRRGIPMLYKPNGDDFVGGVLVRNLPAVHKERNLTEREYANGDRGFVEVGRGTTNSWLRGFEIEASSDETVEDLTAYIGKGDGVFFIEARGKRYMVRFLKAEFSVNRQEVKSLNNTGRLVDRTFLYRHIATIDQAEVLAEADM